MVAGAGRGIASSSNADTATDPLMQRNAASAARLLRTAAMTAGGTAGFAAAARIILRWFSTMTPPCLRNEALGQLGGDEAAILFLCGRPLQQNAGVIDDKPIILGRFRHKPRRVVAPIGAPDETPIARDRLGPNDGQGPGLTHLPKLRFVSVPDERPGRNAVAVTRQSEFHGAQTRGKVGLIRIARQQPRRVTIGRQGKASGDSDGSVAGGGIASTIVTKRTVPLRVRRPLR